MAKVIALNFSGPLQSWAGPAVVKTRVDTNSAPSARAIRGLLAACFGVPRGGMAPASLVDASIEVRTLRKGRVVSDFQIISNRAGEEEYLSRVGSMINLGKRAPKVLTADNQGNNSITRRTYLADAQFIVTIQGVTDGATEEIYSALREPVWSPYLGKKAFAPTFPFLLGVFDEATVEDDVATLLAEIFPPEEVSS